MPGGKGGGGRDREPSLPDRDDGKHKDHDHGRRDPDKDTSDDHRHRDHQEPGKKSGGEG
jgi:hypothetical protein